MDIGPFLPNNDNISLKFCPSFLETVGFDMPT
jgi:hypothetical protein